MNVLADENEEYFSPEYEDFLDKYDQTILIAFGSDEEQQKSFAWLTLIKALFKFNPDKIGVVMAIPHVT